eukprot:5567719-Amphidinium_carterae.1
MVSSFLACWGAALDELVDGHCPVYVQPWQCSRSHDAVCPLSTTVGQLCKEYRLSVPSEVIYGQFSLSAKS